MTNEEIHQLAQRLRIDSIRAADAANPGTRPRRCRRPT